jgi:hypothetical protein
MVRLLVSFNLDGGSISGICEEVYTYRSLRVGYHSSSRAFSVTFTPALVSAIRFLLSINKIIKWHKSVTLFAIETNSMIGVVGPSVSVSPYVDGVAILGAWSQYNVLVVTDRH